MRQENQVVAKANRKTYAWCMGIIFLLVSIVCLGVWIKDAYVAQVKYANIGRIPIFNMLRSYELKNGELPESLHAGMDWFSEVTQSKDKTQFQNQLKEWYSHSTNEVRIYTGMGGWVYDPAKRILGYNSPRLQK